MAKIVAKTYGDALFESGLENQILDTLYEEVMEVDNILAQNEEFTRFLCHPKITKEEKVEVVQNVLKGKVCDQLLGLICVVLEKGRQQYFHSIFSYFVDCVKEHKGIGVVEVTSALPLTDTQKKEIEEKLLQTTSYHTLEVSYKEDSSLIGGVVIRIGDRVVDGSIKQRLYDLQKQLMNIQI